MAYTFRLTEELARWAFEVACQRVPDWYIAFTNPTAGPWKTIKCTDRNGKVGEVFRFELEETRPDILLVNDILRLVLILEAKDTLAKLIHGDQAKKSVEVVARLADTLAGLERNPYWGPRARYTVMTGLLWGAERPTAEFQRAEVFDAYYDQLCRYPGLERRLILGVETCRLGDRLNCSLCAREYETSGTSPWALAPLADSFQLPILE